MGEAKTKAKCDPTFGVIKKDSLKRWRAESQAEHSREIDRATTALETIQATPIAERYTYQDIAKELLEMSLYHPKPFDSFDRSPFLGVNRDLTRELGAKLNEIGGTALMFRVATLIHKRDQRELDLAWDSIGDWKS